MNQQASNPFENRQQQPQPSAQRNAVAQSDGDRAIQEVQAAMVIAKKFPRDPVSAMDKILQDCTRKTLAEGALYSYTRGGTDVTGPSIRLAESAAQNWGNIQFGVRELEQTLGVESVVEAYAWDLETNVRQSRTFTVPHQRKARGKINRVEDPRDIYELVANNGARRLRACILSVIPGDVIEQAVNQCELTLQQHADTSPEAIKKMVESFYNEYGVSDEQIQKRIGSRTESIRPAQMVQMKKIYASLRDGMSKPADWFEFAESGSTTSLNKSSGNGQQNQEQSNNTQQGE